MSSSYQNPDFYSKKANQEGKRARSYYKIQEIDQKFDLLKSDQEVHILDLGCAPGAWCQYFNEKTRQSTIIGVDLQKTEGFPGSKNKIKLIQGDIRNISQLLPQNGIAVVQKFDLIVSDLAPKTTGNPEADSYLSYELVLEVLKIAQSYLKPSGVWVSKYFEGSESQELKPQIRNENYRLKVVKPQACRKQSVEIYLIALSK